MTYNVYFMPKGHTPYNSRGYTLFDIELWLHKSDIKTDKWYTEIRCLPIVEGLTYFLKEKFEENVFNYKEFISDANDIQEIRGFLWTKLDNSSKPYEEAVKFKNDFRKIVDENLKKFKDKYGLYISED